MPATPASQPETLDSYKYVGFEDQFRGSAEDIRRRVLEYLPVFQKAQDVLDVGCGRGEFLGVLKEHGVRARGIDVNGAMVAVCREHGLDATEADALAYLRSLPDGSLGGLFAAQVIEHLEPRYLVSLLDAAAEKLRPGAPIVLETINPACWFAFFESYIRDITHVRPIHPETLQYLLVASGFQRVEIRYRAPYPDHEKLQPIAANPSLGEAVDTLNANVERINRLLFTWLDYAAIGHRP
jgi:O-antigen chain-terminating methyltransferase